MTFTSEPRRISPADFKKMFEGVPQPQPTLRNAAQSFGTVLQRLRTRSGMTLRQLEQMSGVPNPVISAIENGRRRCGASVAKRLADALFAVNSDSARSEFLYAAAATIKARGVIEDAQLYPPAILDAVASRLRAMKIRDRDIFTVHVEPGAEGDLLVVLHGGRRLKVRIKITEEKKQNIVA